MKPEILERQIAHAGYVTVERLRMRLTDGVEVSREVERHGDAVAVLPYDVERRSALVVRLLRAPVLVASGEEMSEEACAGMIENEDADLTARREAYEELGVDLPSLEFVARVWSSPGGRALTPHHLDARAQADTRDATTNTLNQTAEEFLALANRLLRFVAPHFSDKALRATNLPRRLLQYLENNRNDVPIPTQPP
jgi:8-oxo-dGTP pyrophosphatase MutT (NUDIX family)